MKAYRKSSIASLSDARNVIIECATILSDNCMKLSIENERLSREAKTPEPDSMTPAQRRIYDEGRKYVFKEGFCDYYGIKANINEDGSIDVQTFESWRDAGIKYSIPSFISKDDFIEEFDKELHDLYEKRKAEKIADLKEEE